MIKQVSAVAMITFGFALAAPTVYADDSAPESSLEAKILENIKPVGQVNVGSAPAAAAAAAPAAAAAARSGKDIVTGTCVACHGTGVAGAPKLGDKAAWSPRASKGVDGLLKNAIHGLNAMPPRGTCADCSDDELKGAIEYMLKRAGL